MDEGIAPLASEPGLRACTYVTSMLVHPERPNVRY
jgi:hypothetical protein